MHTITIVQAVVLGVIQGLTEFLPISSTAHLRIIPALLGWQDIGAEFTAVIQLGTLLAVLIYFWRDLVRLTVAFFRDLAAFVAGGFKGSPWPSHDARLAWLIGLGTIPIAVCGLLFKGFIKSTARSLWVEAAALIVLAVVLAIAERIAERRKGIEDVEWKEGLGIGLAQTLALVPGASRSGTTITGALLLGLTREAAARFSFLLSVPAVLLSGVYELYEIRHDLSAASAPALAVATVVSFVVGFASIAWLLRYLRSHSTYVFVGYRILLGVALVALLATGVLSAT
jgi:undecaprenyl-diphosphatase